MIRFLLSSILCISLLSCVKNNNKPVWLDISEWTVEKNTHIDAENAGVLTHNLSDGWVYVNGKLLGIFELPCKVPVLIEGSAIEIIVYPTIKNNGISDTKKIYPFCESYSTTLDLTAGSIHKITPTTRYTTTTKFWIEDFEDPSLKLKTNPSYGIGIKRESDPAHQLTPGFYGHIHLTAVDSIFQAFSDELLPLERNKDVYMEIDYKNNVSLISGIIAYTPTTVDLHPYLILTPQESTPVWKKMYVDLKEVVSTATTAVAYDALLKAAYAEIGEDNDIYIDNIKIVYN